MEGPFVVVVYSKLVGLFGFLADSRSSALWQVVRSVEDAKQWPYREDAIDVKHAVLLRRMNGEEAPNAAPEDARYAVIPCSAFPGKGTKTIEADTSGTVHIPAGTLKAGQPLRLVAHTLPHLAEVELAFVDAVRTADRMGNLMPRYLGSLTVDALHAAGLVRAVDGWPQLTDEGLRLRQIFLAART